MEDEINIKIKLMTGLRGVIEGMEYIPYEKKEDPFLGAKDFDRSHYNKFLRERTHDPGNRIVGRPRLDSMLRWYIPLNLNHKDAVELAGKGWGFLVPHMQHHNDQRYRADWRLYLQENHESFWHPWDVSELLESWGAHKQTWGDE